MKTHMVVLEVSLLLVTWLRLKIYIYCTIMFSSFISRYCFRYHGSLISLALFAVGLSGLPPCPSACLPVCLSVCRSTCLSLSLCLSVCLSVCLLSACLRACLSRSLLFYPFGIFLHFSPYRSSAF